MKLSKQLATGFSSFVLAGTLAVGVASASGGEGTDPGNINGRSHQTLTPEQKCAKQSEIEAKAAKAQQRIADRIATLQDRRAQAEAAGHADRVANIDRRIARLQQLSERIQARLDKYEAWVADNCPVSTPEPTSVS